MSKHKTVIRNVEWNDGDSGVVFINFMLFKAIWFGLKAKLLFSGSLALAIKDDNYLDLNNSILMDTSGSPLEEQDLNYKCALLLLAAKFEEACWEPNHAKILTKSVLDFGKMA